MFIGFSAAASEFATKASKPKAKQNREEVFVKVCCFMMIIRQEYGGIENNFTTASYTLIPHEETHAAWLPVQREKCQADRLLCSSPQRQL